MNEKNTNKISVMYKILIILICITGIVIYLNKDNESKSVIYTILISCEVFTIFIKSILDSILHIQKQNHDFLIQKEQYLLDMEKMKQEYSLDKNIVTKIFDEYYKFAKKYITTLYRLIDVNFIFRLSEDSYSKIFDDLSLLRKQNIVIIPDSINDKLTKLEEQISMNTLQDFQKTIKEGTRLDHGNSHRVEETISEIKKTLCIDSLFNSRLSLLSGELNK